MVAQRFKNSVVAVIASFAAIGVAHAADLAIPPLAPVQDFSGWYLRGDIGFSNQRVGSLFNQNYSRFDSVTNIDKGFDAAPLFGLGVGYSINNWLRLDVTGEYRARANFHGLDIGFTAVPGPGGNNFWPDRYSASKFEWTFLFNGYVDLGTWWNFTPFLGAGVGFTRNTITNFGDINVSTAVGADAHSSDASKWNFAWALYAGIGYRVTDALTLELAYRYIDLGDATTGTMIGFTGNTDTPFVFRHLTSQDLKLGLRFNFGAYDLLPPPPPLRSKG
jgi:opacity protein-like surface antigen